MKKIKSYSRSTVNHSLNISVKLLPRHPVQICMHQGDAAGERRGWERESEKTSSGSRIQV